MNNHYRSIAIFLLLFGLLLMTGCQPVINLQENIASTTPTLQIVTLTATDSMYPSTPEEVIRAFLISYPVDQIYAVQYLSPSYVQGLDAQSVSKLLPASGEINGFIIESGSSSAEMEKSEILTNIAFSDSAFEILFSLEIVDGRWAITKILSK